MEKLKAYIEALIEDSITTIKSINGGDISSAYRIDTSKNSYFLKQNTSPIALAMFQTEAYGLNTIAKTNTIKTPSVLACESFEDSAFLLMEYIEWKSPSSEDFKNLGRQLAQLHKHTSESFGLEQNNFIGRLSQSNTKHTSWVNFYTNERLLPQLELAKQKGLLQSSECPNLELIKPKLKPIFDDIKPSLLHGDLWSGNYLISKNGQPYLIDPAVYYGHHEIDIAMTKIFGGFGDPFYTSYSAAISPDKHTEGRIEIYQLYYLLAHLNMFGKSYYESVSSILTKYF